YPSTMLCMVPLPIASRQGGAYDLRLPVPHHIPKFRPREILELTPRMAEEDEASDGLPGGTEGASYPFGICAPAGDPAGGKAERVGREQEVHARRAAGQLLLPFRDLVLGRRRGDEDDQLP